MSIILDNHNVFDYLADLNLGQVSDRDASEVELIAAKNFNLLIHFPSDRYLLVKQEVQDSTGRTSGEFHAEWRMQELIAQLPELGDRIRRFLPEILHFDPDNSILVVKFLDDHHDLARYYEVERQFDPLIARAIGKLLATIHGHTFERSEYRQFLADRPTARDINSAIGIIQRLARIAPGVFATIPRECLQFFKLYQRFPSLPQAIEELGNSVQFTCLIHNDLKLNNFLLDRDWDRPNSHIIKLIDWERSTWGDPAFDLGCTIGSYLEIWLEGLVISNSLSIQESLQLATTPLEVIQPSLLALVDAYIEEFPQILVARPYFFNWVVKFAGLSLIKRIEIIIENERIFGNQGIIMLQVAKQLLCEPKTAKKAIFGNNFNH
jgi:thiamine kinase-like enzyme